MPMDSYHQLKLSVLMFDSERMLTSVMHDSGIQNDSIFAWCRNWNQTFEKLLESESELFTVCSRVAQAISELIYTESWYALKGFSCARDRFAWHRNWNRNQRDFHLIFQFS